MLRKLSISKAHNHKNVHSMRVKLCRVSLNMLKYLWIITQLVAGVENFSHFQKAVRQLTCKGGGREHLCVTKKLFYRT